MRKKLLLALMTLTLMGAAAACPVIPNRAIYGAADMPSVVTPVCDERFEVFKRAFADKNAWLEMYEAPTDVEPERFLRPFLTGLYSRGYERSGEPTEEERSLTFRYRKASTGQIILMRVFWLENETDHVYIVIVGSR